MRWYVLAQFALQFIPERGSEGILKIGRRPIFTKLIIIMYNIQVQEYRTTVLTVDVFASACHILGYGIAELRIAFEYRRRRFHITMTTKMDAISSDLNVSRDH